MFLHVDVRNNVVVLECVLAWTEIPRLLFWVILALLESFKFVVEVHHIVCLLVTEGCVSIPSKHINHILFLCLFNCFFSLFIIVDLCDWIIKEILFFNKLCSHFDIRISNTLEVSLFINVVVKITFPF